MTEERGSRMSRLVVRDTIFGTVDDLDKAQQELDAEMRLLWEGRRLLALKVIAPGALESSEGGTGYLSNEFFFNDSHGSRCPDC